MDPITIGLLAGAGVGLLKGGVLDRQKEQRQRKQEAEIQRWSPWTGMQAQRVQEADPLGAAMQGGMTGAMVGNAMGPAAAPGGMETTESAAGANAADVTGMPKSNAFGGQTALVSNGSAGAMGAGTPAGAMNMQGQRVPWQYMNYPRG